MKIVTPCEIGEAEVTAPGSKSYTHRILIASALSDGLSVVSNALESEDTILTLGALEQMGVATERKEGNILLHGTSGTIKPCNDGIYLKNSGTSMRLLTGIAALGPGPTVLSGSDRMHERPIDDLLDSLNQMGVTAQSIHDNRCPPVRISGGNIAGGKVDIRCKISSQYLSALLLIAPFTKNGLEINVTEGPVSKPYVDMTVDVMSDFGVKVEREGYEKFFVPGGQVYKSGNYRVEGDCSQASYFWAAAAVTGGSVKVKGINKKTRQGDIRITEVLEKMGCKVINEDDGIRVIGGDLKGVTVDMADMPDMVPTLGVVAAFAKGTTEITNVAHLKAKESDRLASVATELQKMGINAQCHDSGLVIQGGEMKGAEIETYDDHRIAMSFAVAGLAVPGVKIRDEMCVKKSFPRFWEVLEEAIYKR